MLVSENLSAWVEIEGIAAQEYNIKVKEDPKRVTCWIASEEGKKYGTSLGAVEHEESATAELWDCIDHLATFSFKYRPLALLQANGIAPPPPPASASPDPEEIDGAVSAEEKELKHQMEIMQQRLAELEKSRGAKRVKEEPDTAAQRARKRVKRGPKSAFVPGEVIDLTSE
ncbi:hypothetical protein PC9H_009357 [Pleurotus ostreatus]|uniref:Uncharacterized protein n=1 Tax=Pleurotus ostreatus TaxID=5322 RepID=A0A8H6ZR78_PLEOS|nr:uncharacterized protein PC9H_009357 [Pleurotus ostreatus]KAF7424056.1 hypothetical protein PC9H_009357 [Pleurotus ostreatus]